MRALVPLLVSVALLLPACSKKGGPCDPHTPSQPVPTAPPEPLPEEVIEQPNPGMEWVAGHWHWDSVRWVWLPGHWESPPGAGMRWCPPRYTGEGGAHAYRPGAFGCGGGGEP